MSAGTKQALIDYADELESESEGSGISYLKALRAICLAKISAGSASEYVSSTVNGQSFAVSHSITAVDMLSMVSEALKEVRGEAAKLTYPTFSGIPY